MYLGKLRQPHKKNQTVHFHTMHKNKFKWIKDLKKHRQYALLTSIFGSNFFFDVSLGKGNKSKQMRLPQNQETFAQWHYKQNKKGANWMKENIYKHLYDKGLRFKIHK